LLPVQAIAERGTPASAGLPIWGSGTVHLRSLLPWVRKTAVLKPSCTDHTVRAAADRAVVDLEPLVERAWQIGQQVDLTGVGYGRIHWDNLTDVSPEAPPYYRFLAGLAAAIGATTAFEIGTHWGGSAVAILRGMRSHSPEAKVVTIDITTESDNYLPKLREARNIVKIVGDANKRETIELVLTQLPAVDLLYVDADHTALPTLLNFAIYSTLLRPKVAVFDDITFSDSMREFWRIVETVLPKQSINCSVVEPAIRGEPGFGLVAWPERLACGRAGIA
jgi:hypothetical protein